MREGNNITSGNILEVTSVTKRFGAFLAVDDVSLSVREGEFLTLLGPSGCGKTTLLRMIAGFEWPTSGEIAIGGKRMNEAAPYARPIGMVFQNLALFPHLSVGENVAYGLKARRVDRRQIEHEVTQALAMLGLAGFERRYVHELSGGQKQRIALARALVIRPKVLLLDEPLSALDMKLRRQLQRELKQIQQQVGTTFIFVTHDQEEALTMSDRIAVFSRGRIEQVGTPREVYGQPATPFVAQFVGESNFMIGVVMGREGDVFTIRLDPTGQVVPVRSATSFDVGSRVGLSVRPEQLALGGEQGAYFEGRVSDLFYVGANTRYTIEAADQAFIALQPSTQGGHAGWRPGDTVRISWPLDGAALVPADEHAAHAR
ncbi:ABC transporter ATP-binding protein [Bradyrhizobium sp. U87765 SZCCT0131]|uniref:ABC transporter ATP-binding protein n=1 Tax=unclassified Bradyrhizobium TaxID=2631580 RepID=UPI001BA4C8FA|nr:ABC transporter ATP-binding protein [Bradyrhizobium sp. U87765 SZCCT0131]MBR1259026.1 ABC transporter ATP-binding protein [Bradyrhizobium sp. U87765 SZCCT0134]MBR1305167.1 ABC transporter ATP-binding protein [Bradyrhizobium sp. U87765 SZCCT0110]MBR1320953.1 ABC transporter ATP-binding protein [Bradyrhizobium sp. U87765 SZCCT0109]MBR1350393.1 ABC transporter ATP-binding protein [Bradyrhizobium sp. U87765 SZCCT0048]